VTEIGSAGNGIRTDAMLAAALGAIDPAGLGGVVWQARAGPVLDRWLARLRHHLPADALDTADSVARFRRSEVSIRLRRCAPDDR